MSMIDYRRTDERDHVGPNPFWIRSAKMEFGGKAGFSSIMDDNEAVFMDFPLRDKGAFPVLIQGVVVEILTAFIGGTVAMTIGNGTIPTPNSSDGATVSVVAATSVMASAVVIPGTIGNKLASPLLVPFLLIPANAATPVLYAALTSSGTITAGACRINVLVSEVS